MPARTIGKSAVTLTGQFYSSKNRRVVAFESPVERDLLLLLEFDPRVSRYEEQPLRIPWTDAQHRPHHFTPDALAYFGEPLSQTGDASPRLFEAKTIKQLRKHGREFAASFRAARHFAREQAWRFSVIFDRDLRSPLVDNVRFLQRYLQSSLRDPDVLDRLRQLATSGSVTSVRDLLVQARDLASEETLTDGLWHLVALHQVVVDLRDPLTEATAVWPPEAAHRNATAIAQQLRLMRSDVRRVVVPSPALREAKLIRYAEADLDLSAGSLVSVDGVRCVVVRAADFERLLIRDDRGLVRSVSLADVRPIEGTPPPMRPELSTVRDEDWKRAMARYDAIEPLLKSPARDASRVQQIAQSLRVHASTVYRWVERARANGVGGLLDQPRTGGRGQFRVAAGTGEVITAVLSTRLSGGRPRSIPKLIGEVLEACRVKQVPVPHANTVRNRIKAMVIARAAAPIAPGATAPEAGHFPHATTALSVAQIDHSISDVILVDDEHRRSIGRPWVTIAIDVSTRVVLGLLISLDPPSTLSVALCLYHVLFPKETWLAELGLGELTWPCYGSPGALHADNAREFRGVTLKRAAELHRIRLEWRPVKTPRYGAHIERLMGTVQTEMKILPGATDSDVVKRGDLHPDASAVMTLREYAIYLTRFIAGQYHLRPHAGLEQRTPLQAWRDAVLPSAEGPGIGLPPRLANRDRVHLDFLPMTQRMVRKDGLWIDKLHYYDAVLQRFMVPKYAGKQFTIRVDPRDLRCVYLLDPNSDEYLRIWLADRSRPRISQFELREANRTLRARSDAPVTEAAIFAAIQKNRALVEAATEKTAKARRKRQRRREHDASQPRPAQVRDASAGGHLAAAESSSEPPEPMPPAPVVRPWVGDDEEVEYQ